MTDLKPGDSARTDRPRPPVSIQANTKFGTWFVTLGDIEAAHALKEAVEDKMAIRAARKARAAR